MDDILLSEYPDGRILNERYLLDSQGQRVPDPLTGVARRVDKAVVEKGNIIDAIEVTSMTARKRAQIERTNRIRANGGQFMYDPVTKSLIDISAVKVRIERLP